MGNREKLLAGAKRCLFEKGYADTTVRDIAAAAGVSMAAIGYHFGSKENLLNEALFQTLDEGGGEVGTALVGEDADGSPADRMQARWARLIDSFTRNRTFWLANIEAVQRALRSPELRPGMSAGQQEGRSGAAAVLSGVPEQELPDDVVRSLGSVQLALMGGLMMQWLVDPEKAPTAAEIVAGIRHLSRLVEEGPHDS